MAELEASLKESREREETCLSQLKYARADLENLQKQTQRRIDEGLARGTERLVMELLPIAEELDLAIEAAKESGERGILKGVEMVKRKLDRVLEGEGLTPIEALGRPFDPRIHEAVLEAETNDSPSGTVVEEFRRGYLFRGRVLRASMVKVARNPSSTEAQEVRKDG